MPLIMFKMVTFMLWIFYYKKKELKKSGNLLTTIVSFSVFFVYVNIFIFLFFYCHFGMVSGKIGNKCVWSVYHI